MVHPFRKNEIRRVFPKIPQQAMRVFYTAPIESKTCKILRHSAWISKPGHIEEMFLKDDHQEMVPSL